MLTIIDEYSLDFYRGGFSGAFLALGGGGFGLLRPPQSINVTVSPSIVAIPFLQNAKNSFNFIGNSNSFAGSDVSVGDMWLS